MYMYMFDVILHWMSKGCGKYPVARAIAKGEGRHVDHAGHKGLRGCHKGVPPRGPLQTSAKRSRV